MEKTRCRFNQQEAIDLATRYAKRLPETPDRVMFTWHQPELHEVSLFGLTLSQSRYVGMW